MFLKQAEADQPNACRVGKGRYATTMGSYYHVPCAQPSDSHSPVLRMRLIRCVNIATGETKAAGRGVSHPTHTRGSAGGAAIANCQPSQTTALGPGPPGGGESICTIVAGAWSHRLTGYSQNACGKGSAAGVCTQLWRGECGGNSTPAAPLAYLKLRAGPGAPRGNWHGYNATRTRREETGGFPLTATIGDNYLCQPHDGATRGGARPAVAASCPTPHATARGTLRPCGVTDSRAELVRVRSKCHRRCQPRALCPVSSPMLPNSTTVNLTGRYEMTFSSTSTPTSVLNAKKPLYWTRPLHTAHLIVPFPPWATSCVIRMWTSPIPNSIPLL
ncbi:uncharacterized protein LOC142930114 [Petromyzon marinus]|uniref:uncharacterized protein LOC142930114 n=1 Tax=Petromyzon marinus TaxID=7757 RepID=UPI003F709C07